MKHVLAIIGLGILAAVGVQLSGTYHEAVPSQQSTGDMQQKEFTLSSPAFQNGGVIPQQYTCDGNRTTNPPLTIENPPEGTRSFALVMDDPDIPQEVKDANGIDVFDHWVMYSIPADTRTIGEGEVVGALGMNGAGNPGYTGPCPPPQYQPTTHRYIFRVYALSGTLQFIQAPTKAEVLAAIGSMTLGEAELIGTYDRTK